MRTTAVNVTCIVLITFITISMKLDLSSDQHPQQATVVYSSLTEAIASRANDDRYIVLAMVDEAFIDMAMNFHEASLARHRIDNYLFVGVGNSTCDALYRHSMACFHYVDDPSAAEASDFGHEDFIRKMNIRTDMILEALEANFSVVHSDLDVSFLANPLPEIKVNLQPKHSFHLLPATVHSVTLSLVYHSNV